jgi:ABC-type Fe3+-hydroxamate transport system substrate-binding protein
VIDAGLADKPVSVVRLSQDANYSIRIGTSESIAFRALGMAQPGGQQNPDDFRVELSLENLNVLNDADTVFLYVDDNAASELETVTQNAVWQSLEPIQNGRVHQVNSGVWNSIDIIGLMRILDDIETYFIAPAEA